MKIACTLIAFAFTLCVSAVAHASQPNITFILVDDLGYGDLGCSGQKLIATPRLDQMADAHQDQPNWSVRGSEPRH